MPSSFWRISELDDEGDGGPGLVVAGPDAPHGAQGPNGVHRITLDVTLLDSGRLDSFKGTFHAAVACSMAHLSRPSGRTLLAPPGLKSTVSRSLCHLLIFINILTFSIAFSMKMKRS